MSNQPQTTEPYSDDVEMSIGRVEAFSDGVFGVAVTLLILNLVVPQIATSSGTASAATAVPAATQQQALISALLSQWPAYLGYLISFMTVGAVWTGHHRLMKFMRRVDHSFQLLNILFLMVIVVIPFTTSLLTRYLNNPALIGIVSIVYGLNWLIAAILMRLMWRYLKYASLIKPHVSAAALQGAEQEFNARGVVFSLLGLAVTVFIPVLGILIYAAAAVINFVIPLAVGVRRSGQSTPRQSPGA